ncbi:sugar transferase [Congregibacter sp.]|uniref:sugar transferase n=1 Tax=Congregibacter sp. TaxID=2744308 RepID=UPI003F6B29E0
MAVVSTGLGLAGNARFLDPARSHTGWIRDAHGGAYPIIKRSTDLIVSSLALLMLSPLLIATAIAVKSESSGPVLFSQTRIGRRGRPFQCWKFRSMYIDAEARKAELQAQNEMDGGTTFKMQRDPRITRVGRFIRKASIDELPQLWNVLVGEMTLVGPRPPVPAEVAQYTAADRLRLSVKPGITCIWQVSGRSDIPFDEQVQLDIRYIRERSLWLDIRLLLATVPAVLFARGAY